MNFPLYITKNYEGGFLFLFYLTFVLFRRITKCFSNLDSISLFWLSPRNHILHSPRNLFYYIHIQAPLLYTISRVRDFPWDFEGYNVLAL